ncbi:hypothetical protein F5Y19DRAFT_476433 [Xylariaceae sp. FL1651]|nr:hypothetical protein F5Y19DRAFT_476433 [Xylariaceae sp. FL1651]
MSHQQNNNPSTYWPAGQGQYQHQGMAYPQYNQSPGYGQGVMTQQQYQQLQYAWLRSRIVQVGEGTIVAGQSTKYYDRRSQAPLCYQCCKRVPLRTLADTHGKPCGGDACERAEGEGLAFIPMPDNAVKACAEFRTLLPWWMDKLDVSVHKDIEERARGRLGQSRDAIPDVSPPEES